MMSAIVWVKRDRDPVRLGEKIYCVHDVLHVPETASSALYSFYPRIYTFCVGVIRF